jgi:hypothetical protein
MSNLTTQLAWAEVAEDTTYPSWEARGADGHHYIIMNVGTPRDTPWAAITSGPQRARMEPTFGAAQLVCQRWTEANDEMTERIWEGEGL